MFDAGHDGHVRLLDADPDLAAGLSHAEWDQARRAVVVPAVRRLAGTWTPPDDTRGTIGALVVGGMLIRAGSTFGRPHLHVIGPGDMVDGRILADPENAWRVLDDAHLAVLDDRFVRAARRWPPLIGGLARRLFETQREQETIAAIVAMPRVEDRLLALLCHLACRWGHVTPDGVTVRLPITHEVLGRLAGARRPTVTLALTALKEQHLLRRQSAGTWLLPSDCHDWLTDGLPVVGEAIAV